MLELDCDRVKLWVRDDQEGLVGAEPEPIEHDLSGSVQPVSADHRHTPHELPLPAGASAVASALPPVGRTLAA